MLNSSRQDRALPMTKGTFNTICAASVEAFDWLFKVEAI